MDFHGFQKMTLLDFPGKVACTVFTGGCNLRCPFCHNALLVTQLNEAETYSQEEILSFLSKRKGLLDGVAVTGGEPLMNPGLIDFICKVKEMGYCVKLDTNGCYPERLKEIVNAGLVDYVAMDIKNTPRHYGETVGIADFDVSKVKESVAFLMEGRVDYEFRTTVVGRFHTVEIITEIAQWIEGAKHYFLQNFIDSGNLIGEGMTGVSAEEMEQMRAAASKYVPVTALRGI